MGPLLQQQRQQKQMAPSRGIIVCLVLMHHLTLRTSTGPTFFLWALPVSHFSSAWHRLSPSSTPPLAGFIKEIFLVLVQPFLVSISSFLVPFKPIFFRQSDSSSQLREVLICKRKKKK